MRHPDHLSRFLDSPARLQIERVLEEAKTFEFFASAVQEYRNMYESRFFPCMVKDVSLKFAHVHEGVGGDFGL